MPDWQVSWTDAARSDLHAIVSYIAQDNPTAALAVAERLERKAARLQTLPLRGRIVPELSRVGERRYREIIERPWHIVYRPDAPHVWVVAVVDGRRDLTEWLQERTTAPAR